MKKLLIILCLCTIHPTTTSANSFSPQEQAEKIYDNCQKQIPVVNEKTSSWEIKPMSPTSVL
ncbi:MAG: hypothetical protein J6J35_00315 [Alphaproteobacteria bacterium]|nr:hypothetical protein [Alphaproteobacteria bacterium]